ncbi:MAG: hypothetical protein ACKO7P_00085 [Bacteroidota bacterium]
MKNKFKNYLVIGLIALNAVCVYFLMRPHRGPHHPPKITDIIHFDKDTKSKIDKMEKAHFNQMGRYSKKIKGIRKSIYLNNDRSDKIDFDSVFAELAENQKEIEKLRFQYFTDIKSLCNEKQEKELDLFVKRMLEHEAMRRPKGK